MRCIYLHCEMEDKADKEDWRTDKHVTLVPMHANAISFKLCIREFCLILERILHTYLTPPNPSIVFPSIPTPKT